MYPEMTVLSLR